MADCTTVCMLQTLQMFESVHIKAEASAASNQNKKPKGVQPVRALGKEVVWPIRAEA